MVSSFSLYRLGTRSGSRKAEKSGPSGDVKGKGQGVSKTEGLKGHSRIMYCGDSVLPHYHRRSTTSSSAERSWRRVLARTNRASTSQVDLSYTPVSVSVSVA